MHQTDILQSEKLSDSIGINVYGDRGRWFSPRKCIGPVDSNVQVLCLFSVRPCVMLAVHPPRPNQDSEKIGNGDLWLENIFIRIAKLKGKKL